MSGGGKQMVETPLIMQQWMIGEGDDDAYNTSISVDEDSSNVSNGSTASSSELRVEDDDVASSCSSSNSNSNGPLYELSELMAQLPIKRGLSKYYEGKSESFTCLSRAMSIEDLVKRENPSCRNKIKACKSYTSLPKRTIAKKVSRGSLSSLSFPGRRATFLNTIRHPAPNRIPVQKKF